MKAKMFILSSLFLLIISCSQQPSICKISTAGHKVDTITIDPANLSAPLDTTQYAISEIFTLETTKETHIYNPSSVKRIDDRIYIMTDDHNGNHTIYVYNDEGRFIHVLGKRGRAKDEYNGSPTCFSFDYKSGNVHVYESSGNRIMVFDNKGEFLHDVRFEDGFPNSVCVTESGDYVCAYDVHQHNYNDRLAVCDNHGNTLKSLLPIGKDESFGMMSSHLDFDESRCYFHHPFYDVIAVLRNNDIEKFYKIDFGGAFIPEDLADEAIRQESFSTVFENHNGVQGLERFESSGDLIHLNSAT